MIYYPNAKINIGLNVVAKRPDGYHDLETVFYPINLQDAIEMNVIEDDVPMCGYRLKVTGNTLGGTPEDNLVIKAYKLFQCVQAHPDRCRVRWRVGRCRIHYKGHQ